MQAPPAYELLVNGQWLPLSFGALYFDGRREEWYFCAGTFHGIRPDTLPKALAEGWVREVAPATIGTERAHRLHTLIGSHTRHHAAYVSCLIGRNVERLRDLTESEAGFVERHVRATRARFYMAA
jgi:hypothetical protein